MNALLSEALQEFTGLLKQLMTNLLGNDAETWGNEFRKFLRKETCWRRVIDASKFKTLAIVRTGVRKSANAYFRLFTERGVICTEYAAKLTRKMIFSSGVEEHELVVATPWDLGIELESVGPNTVTNQAYRLGLYAISAEAAAELAMEDLKDWRYRYKDLVIPIANGTLQGEAEHDAMFYLRCKGVDASGRDIDATTHTMWAMSAPFVFGRYKKR